MGSIMSPAFDYQGTLQRFGQDQRLFSEMVGFFFSDAPQWIETIHAGVANNDVGKIRRGAHTLKGMVANFGAARAMTAAAQLEQHASIGNLAAVQRALPILEEAIEELQQAFIESGLHHAENVNNADAASAEH